MIMVLMLISSSSAISHIKSLESYLIRLVKDRIAKVEQTNQLLGNINIIARGLRSILIEDNHGHKNNEIQRITESRKKSANSSMT